jgi:Arc/MetJ-type ribon-helix-helix transcriptional regulator
MAEVRKISVSMPPEVIDHVRAAARATGESVSAWLVNAAVAMLDEQSRLEIGRLAAEQLVADYEEEFGPIPPEITEDVRAFLAHAEAGQRQPPSDREAG